MHIAILLTLSIPPGEAELPVCVRYDAYLHPEPPGPVHNAAASKEKWRITTTRKEKTVLSSLAITHY